MSRIKKQLPEGWTKSALKDIIKINYGKGLPQKKRIKGVCPVYGSNGIIGYHDKAQTQGATIIIGRKGSVGKVHLSKVPCWPIDTTYYIDSLVALDMGFIFYLLRNLNLEDLDSSSTIPGINRNQIYEFNIQLPPLTEQKRIADKIKELLISVNRVKERLDSISDILKCFRQSVLSDAVTGKLTEDWREKESISHWSNITVKKIASKIQYGYTASANQKLKVPKFLRITDIQEGKVDWCKVPSCKIEIEQIDKYKLEKGDVVFARTGATTGKSFLIDKCPLAIFASYLIRIKPDCQKVVPNYLYLFFQSDSYWEQIVCKLSGSAQPNCNATKLSKLQLRLPPLEEQKQIIRRVETLFQFVNKIEERISKAKERVKKLAQSILAKAFLGELVPTEAKLAKKEDRSYETAEELLSRIKSERERPSKHETEGKIMKKRTIRVQCTTPDQLTAILSRNQTHKFSPEQLFSKAGFGEDSVDEFYELLRECVVQKQIMETRTKKGKIFLEGVE